MSHGRAGAIYVHRNSLVNEAFGSKLEKIGSNISLLARTVLDEYITEWESLASVVKERTEDLCKITQGVKPLESMKETVPEWRDFGEFSRADVEAHTSFLRDELPRKWNDLSSHMHLRLVELETKSRSPSIRQAIEETFTSAEARSAFPSTSARRRVGGEQALEANILLLDNRKGVLLALETLKALEQRMSEAVSRTCQAFELRWEQERFNHLKGALVLELEVLLEGYHPEFVYFNAQQRLDALVSMQREHLRVLTSFVITQVDFTDLDSWQNHLHLVQGEIRKCIDELSLRLRSHNCGLIEIAHDVHDRWSPLFSELVAVSPETVVGVFEEGEDTIRSQAFKDSVVLELPEALTRSCDQETVVADVLHTLASTMMKNVASLLGPSSSLADATRVMDAELEALHNSYLQQLAKLDDEYVGTQREMDLTTDEVVLNAAADKAKIVLSKIRSQHEKFHAEAQSVIAGLLRFLDEDIRCRRQKFCDLYEIRPFDRPGSGKSVREEQLVQMPDGCRYLLKNPKDETSYLLTLLHSHGATTLTNLDWSRPLSPARRSTSASIRRNTLSSLTQTVKFPHLDVLALFTGLRIRWLQDCLAYSHNCATGVFVEARNLVQSKNVAISNEMNSVLFALDLRQTALAEQVQERLIEVLESVDEIEAEYESRISRKMNSNIEEFRRMCHGVIQRDLLSASTSTDCDIINEKLNKEFESALIKLKEDGRAMEDKEVKITHLRRLIRRPLTKPRQVTDHKSTYESNIEKLKTVMIVTLRSLEECRDEIQFVDGVQKILKLLKSQLRSEVAKGNHVSTNFSELCAQWKSLVSTTTLQTQKV
ncbi:hypothetical protein HDU93_009675 [Gonapodya sp. JEL0774]|nr:hypothetical protein HDU93_009675 [Gonapodya sp. JEL0774]